jgi:hypothetical protein
MLDQFIPVGIRVEDRTIVTQLPTGSVSQRQFKLTVGGFVKLSAMSDFAKFADPCGMILLREEALFVFSWNYRYAHVYLQC